MSCRISRKTMSFIWGNGLLLRLIKNLVELFDTFLSSQEVCAYCRMVQSRVNKGAPRDLENVREMGTGEGCGILASLLFLKVTTVSGSQGVHGKHQSTLWYRI